jgi:predicted DNA-binding transcriptional regulator AlpA
MIQQQENSNPKPPRRRYIQPRGLSRVEISHYIGVSPSMWDELVKQGLMPPPKKIGSRNVWDIHQVDRAFDELSGGSDEDRNEWDELSR